MSSLKVKELTTSIKEFLELAKASESASSLEELKSFLEKARKRVEDDEVDSPINPHDPYGDEENPDLSEEQGFREFDPETDEDDADKWLQENDPEKEQDDEEEPTDEYDEYGPDEDEESHQQEPGNDEEVEEQPDEQVEAPAAASEGPESGGPEESPQAPQEEVAPAPEGRFPQPSKEDISEMRQYTRPWEQRARDKTRLEAEAHKNPVLHHEGRLLEARNTAHKSRQDAQKEFESSPEYQGADPVSQMELDAKFDKDWHEKNPDYVSNSMKLHGEAHKKGMAAKEQHAAAKDEQIRHILSGGAQPETPMSTEEGMQHAGGVKGEEGTLAPTISDPASSFASGNREFLSQYAKDYEKKAKKPKNINDMANYDDESRADVGRVLGDHPAMKDPKKKAKVDEFFKKYHPLIAMNAHKVLNKLGIDSKKGDIDLGMLHEAGMHGLFQAINDYEHDHPSKASFATHAGNKIRGLMQTAFKGQDQVPQELRTGSKKFHQQKAAAPKLDLHTIASKHPPEIGDRLKRIQTARVANPPKAPKPPKPEGEGL